MTNKEKRQLKKGKKLRRQYDKIRRKEYSKSHLEKLKKREEIPHSYPKARIVLLRDFITSKDLYKGIGLFLGSQLSIFLLLLGADYPNLTPIIGLLSVVIGLICIVIAVRLVNRRQSKDVSRKPVNYMLVLKVLVVTFLATLLVSTIYTRYGTTILAQPNQEVISSTLSLFPIPMLFTMIIVAPVIEEVIFRELLPYAMGPSILSFILASFLFVVIHSPSGWFGWVNYGISSIGFLYVRLKNNNVYSGVTLHVLWNIMSIFI